LNEKSQMFPYIALYGLRSPRNDTDPILSIDLSLFFFFVIIYISQMNNHICYLYIASWHIWHLVEFYKKVCMSLHFIPLQKLMIQSYHQQGSIPPEVYFL
jgi:hypothetical protein